ncbi:hypothetical protein ACIA58_26570 [Kribbella sp. NPDC051586]|uniref:hypothetical protein n=1 Tax=Kribbella sp. NPDC051586 TaxID=3364118 RepID=UPI00379686B9
MTEPTEIVHGAVIVFCPAVAVPVVSSPVVSKHSGGHESAVPGKRAHYHHPQR